MRPTSSARSRCKSSARSILGWQLADSSAAEAAFREALALAPGDGRATAALEDLFERQRGAPRAAEGRADEAPARVDALVAALRAEIDANLNPDRATALLLSRLAGAARRRERKDPPRSGGRVPGAARSRERSRRREQQGVALRGLQRAYVLLDEHAPLLQALEREHEVLDGNGARCSNARASRGRRDRRGEPRGRRGRSPASRR